MMMSLSASCLEASAQDAAKDSVALQEVVVAQQARLSKADR